MVARWGTASWEFYRPVIFTNYNLDIHLSPRLVVQLIKLWNLFVSQHSVLPLGHLLAKRTSLILLVSAIALTTKIT